MQIEIKEVVSRRQLRRFAAFPNKLYKHNAYYVPQLLSGEMNVLSAKKNPAFEFCEAKYWFACEDNKVVGRVAGIINHSYNKKTGKEYARFGWLDFIEKEEVLHALIQTVEEWARSKNAKILHGPLGFSDFDASGVLVEGFNEIPTAYGKYNFPYYDEFLGKEGFTKETDWVEYNIKVPDATPEKYLTMASIVEKRYNLRCAPVSGKKDLLTYA
ncbi:MAG: N-acetyltransferase, partial [Bacteroidales bacterium]